MQLHIHALCYPAAFQAMTIIEGDMNDFKCRL